MQASDVRQKLRDWILKHAKTAPGPAFSDQTQLLEEGILSSLDIVELNPAYDKRNQTGKLAVDLVESLFGKSTLIR